MAQAPSDMPARLPTWREMHRDTDPQAEAVLFEMWREASFWRKLEMVDDLYRAGREMLLTRLRQQHPDATNADLQRLLADELLGPELVERVYGSKE